ncbi:hypothetical protein GOP47_0015893 [Adiantum capillus-veneris]|nr:hypothetical protein GOP47_0015893 [Adiantum capillus-veneris]
MDSIAAPPSKRRKLMSQTKSQCNSSDCGEGSATALRTAELSRSTTVEFEDSRAHAELREQDTSWPDALSEAQLDLLVRIKQLAMERLISAGETGLEEVLPASALRTIGIVIEELVKDHVRTLASVHNEEKLTASRTSQENEMRQSSNHTSF